MKILPRPLALLATLALAAAHVSTLPSLHAAPVDVSSAENVKPALPKIPARTFNLADFGAVGDGRTMNTDAFKRALAAVAKAGGGRLVVPSGVFRTAPFALVSNLDLHLSAGAVIQAPDTFEALGLPDPASFKTQAEANAAFRVPEPLITGSKLHDVALTGPGTIDGSTPTGGPGPSAPRATSPRPPPAASFTAARISSSSTTANASSFPKSRSPTPRCFTSSPRTSPTSPSNA